MPKSGTASLPLHGGHAPRWLFERMEELSGVIAEAVIETHSRQELLCRLADPYWFQSFGCVIGFDWHSSGLTTTTMAALQESLSLQQHGVTVLGGKGSRSRRTGDELDGLDLPTRVRDDLKTGSRMSARVDGTCLQDAYDLYHHTIVLTERGHWTVVQQGMNDEQGDARRYHWLSDRVEGFLDDPQEAVCCDTESNALDLSASASSEIRQTSLDLINDGPQHIRQYMTPAGQRSLAEFGGRSKHLDMPDHHWIQDHDISQRAIQQLEKAYEVQPSDYEELIGLEGIGKKTLRALALISELVHGDEACWKDPVKYSYAVGGKDGTPYPVDRETYDESIHHMQDIVATADMEREQKKDAFKRLHRYIA